MKNLTNGYMICYTLIMNIQKILNKFNKDQIKEIAKAINIYFNLVSVKRIYELIMQVDSIDTALWLLMCHKQSDESLDNIVYQFLYNKDN